MAKEFKDLLGKTLIEIQVNRLSDEIFFIVDHEERYKLYHSQDCCESVRIEDIVGDLDDLIGTPLLQAEEVTQRDEEASESAKWTFYKLASIKGSVTIRWYGASNGYYSESVDFAEA